MIRRGVNCLESSPSLPKRVITCVVTTASFTDCDPDVGDFIGLSSVRSLNVAVEGKKYVGDVATSEETARVEHCCTEPHLHVHNTSSVFILMFNQTQRVSVPFRASSYLTLQVMQDNNNMNSEAVAK